MKEIFKHGEFNTGCNYWASHAGMKMWSDWREDVVRRDFELLAALKIKTVRVFPLWSDFQPIERVYEYRGKVTGYSVDGGDTLLDSFDSGIDERMMERFRILMDIAYSNGISVIPSLITGWMSGRLFVPPAISDRDVITDPLALKWEIRFVREIVRAFKDHPALGAWCLGNECNCMGNAKTEEEAYLWMASITNAIRAEDSEHRIISGMHSQYTQDETVWTLQMGGELCDYMTTHPYASPTYGTDSEPMNGIKALVHPAIQTAYVRGIAKRDCFIEETGTFGAMYGNEEYNAKYMKGAALTAWAHDCLSYLWWIGFDQGSFKYMPFGLNNRASTYGLYREDMTEKPVGRVMREINEFLEKFPYERLPERIVDGVCILTKGQPTYSVGASAFYLAKQADIDIEFAYSRDEIPESKLYLMPSVDSADCIDAYKLSTIMERVANGATLYMSLGNGFTRNLKDDFGFEILTREKAVGKDEVTLGETNLKLEGTVIYNVLLKDAESLAKNQDGKDVFLRSRYGKGWVYVLMYPMEKNIYNERAAFSDGSYYKIYEILRENIETEKCIRSHSPLVGVTEHKLSYDERIIVVTSYNTNRCEYDISVGETWEFADAIEGDVTKSERGVKACLDNVETAVFLIKRRIV